MRRIALATATFLAYPCRLPPRMRKVRGARSTAAGPAAAIAASTPSRNVAPPCRGSVDSASPTLSGRMTPRGHHADGLIGASIRRSPD